MHLYLPFTAVFAIEVIQASHQTLSMQYRTLPLARNSLRGHGGQPLDLVGWGTRDVEPLIDAGVDGSRCLVLASGNVERASVSAIWRLGNGGVGTTRQLVTVRERIDAHIQADLVLGGLSSDELLPSLSTLVDNVHGVLLVLALAREGKLVLGLAIWDLVDAEPLVCGTEETRQVALDILDVVELGGQWVVYVDDHDLPVGLALVE